MREILTGPEAAEAFTQAFEPRVAEQSPGDSRANLGRQLEVARRRVTNATRLVIEIPDDADIRHQRETDKAEVRRIELALAEQTKGGARSLPDRKAPSAQRSTTS